MSGFPNFPALFAGLFFLLPSSAASLTGQSPCVVLVSFDGFRHDYVDRFETPNFDRVLEEGSRAEALIPVFPSKTFPNHYSIITGMYAGTHGLVGNSFYDPGREMVYKTSDRAVVQDAGFYGGVPLWQWVQQHGMKSASYFWVGSEAPVAGRYPDYYYLYDHGRPNAARVDQTIAWLQMPDSLRPGFISLYFALVDDAGHAAGPNGEPLRKAVEEADAILGRLLYGLDSLHAPVNLLICSDHGMLEFEQNPHSGIYLGDLIDLYDPNIRYINNGTQAYIYAEPEEIARILSGLPVDDLRFEAYREEDFPAHWHIRHPRSGNLILCAKPGFKFTSRPDAWEKRKIVGEHGYDPASSRDVWGIFYARGPGILSGIRVPAFENIHIYPLVCRLLGIPVPDAIDGRPEVLDVIVKK